MHFAARAVEAAPGEVDPADHHRQHVVEVVRDAAGQLADRLHLLDLAKLGFGGLALVGFGLQRCVRLPQLAGALGDRFLERFGALGLGLRLASWQSEFWRSAWIATRPRKIAPSPTITPSQLR